MVVMGVGRDRGCKHRMVAPMIRLGPGPTVSCRSIRCSLPHAIVSMGNANTSGRADAPKLRFM